MKKCNLHTVLWCIGCAAVLCAAIWAGVTALIRNQKKRRLIDCSKQTMRVVGNMLLHAAGEKRL